MGQWGQRWARDLEVEDLDPRHLIWSVHLRLNLDGMPSGRTTIQFEFTDLRDVDRFYWIVVNERKVDVCLKHPGYEPNVCVARVSVVGTRGEVRPNWGYGDTRNAECIYWLDVAKRCRTRRSAEEWP